MYWCFICLYRHRSLVRSQWVLFKAAFIISSSILFLIGSPIFSAVFCTDLFELVYRHLFLTFKWCQEAFLHIFCSNFYPYILRRIEIHSLWHKINICVSWISHYLTLSLILFMMNLSGAAQGWVGGGRGQRRGSLSLNSVTHILQWWYWHSHTLSKEDPKTI